MTTHDLQHFVLTRFNTASPHFPSDRSIDSAWLAARFSLFEFFCLPSMAAQAGDFRWLVFFDVRTPEQFLTRARFLAERVRDFETIEVAGALTDAGIAEAVARRLRSASGKLCTTRLDNDDALALGYLDHVQSVARSARSPVFLNFPLGYQWYEGGLYFLPDFANPFVSFVEDLDAGRRPQTVMCDVSHRDISQLARVQQVLARPQWLQVVHGDNVANTLRGVRRPLTRAPSQFTPGVQRVMRNDGFLVRFAETLKGANRIARVAAKSFFS